MSQEHDREVRVAFADGVRDDVASLVASSASANDTEVETLKRRVAELLVECRTNPYVGELMGSGRHPELADCRRVRVRWIRTSAKQPAPNVLGFTKPRVGRIRERGTKLETCGRLATDQRVACSSVWLSSLKRRICRRDRGPAV